MEGKNPNCAYGRWDCMPCTNCDAYIPTKTNADRIRAMSDEELAQLLKSQGCPSAEAFSCYEHTCKDCWLKWLKQPADKGE